jgi:two-component system chemotaxis response regulator CheB
MKEIKVLIIDDSSVVHVLLERVLLELPDIEVAGNAYSAQEGIRLNRDLNPDVIIMDITMPGMSGLEAIEEIMDQAPVPIIVFSAASRDIVNLSFTAIDKGALDIVEKPESPDIDSFKDKIKSDLVRDIRMFAGFKVVRRFRKSLHEARGKPVTREKGAHKGETPAAGKETTFPVVGIASSTGGPQTVKRFIERLGAAGEGMGIVIVQHMAENFLKGFCDWLNLYSSLPVSLAAEGGRVEAQNIYVAPESYHLTFDSGGKFRYLDEPPVMGIRPSATIMFKSMAQAYRDRVIAVILTGMGDDGSEALAAVKRFGGYVIAQSEESCLLFGMPKAAIATGLVDSVLDLDAIPEYITRYWHGRHPK